MATDLLRADRPCLTQIDLVWCADYRVKFPKRAPFLEHRRPHDRSRANRQAYREVTRLPSTTTARSSQGAPALRRSVSNDAQDVVERPLTPLASISVPGSMADGGDWLAGFNKMPNEGDCELGIVTPQRVYRLEQLHLLHAIGRENSDQQPASSGIFGLRWSRGHEPSHDTVGQPFAALRLRVAAAFFAEADRPAGDARPKPCRRSCRPCDGGMAGRLPRPEPPGSLPPPSSLLTVAQARQPPSLGHPDPRSSPQCGRLCVLACPCILICLHVASSSSILGTVTQPETRATRNGWEHRKITSQCCLSCVRRAVTWRWRCTKSLRRCHGCLALPCHGRSPASAV